MADSTPGWQVFELAAKNLKDGDLSGAIREFGNAVREFTVVGDLRATSHTLDVLASLHTQFGDFEAAELFHKRGLETAQKIPKGQDLAVRHLDGIGVAKSNRGLWQEAVETFEKALQDSRLMPTVKMRRLRARILRHLADVNARYGRDWQRSVELYDQAIAINESFNDRSEKGYCLTFKGLCVEALGDFDSSVRFHDEAREIASAEDDNALLAIANAHLSTAYSHMGNKPLALKFCEEARKLDEKIGNKQGLTRDYTLLGNLVEDEDQEGALKFYCRGFEIARAIGDLQNTLVLTRCIGNIYHGRHQPGRAREFYRSALELCRRLRGDKRIEIELQLEAASVGDLNQFEQTLEQQLSVAREAGLDDIVGQIEESLARYFESKGDRAAAKVRYKNCVDLLERTRTNYRAEEYLRAFSERNDRAYQRLVYLSAVAHDDVAAFEYSERCRARVLASLMHRSSADVSSKQGLRKSAAYRSICERLMELDRRLEAIQFAGRTPPQGLQDELDRTLLEEAEVVFAARRSLGQPLRPDFEVTSLRKVHEQLSAFEEDILLLVYFVTEDDTYLFVIDKHAFELIPLNLKSSVLRTHVLKARQSFGVDEFSVLNPDPSPTGNHSTSPQPSHTPLAEQLIRPAIERIKRSDHVCIVPHGVLHYLPFQALYLDDKYLIEHCPLSYAPSVTALSLSLARQYTPVRRVLAFGDPNSSLSELPFAAAEVEAIADLLGGNCTSKTGRHATKSALLSSGAEAFDAWHIASHAVFIQSAPHLSHFQLAADDEDKGRLFAYEFGALQTIPRLVVASACQTALTKTDPGDEVNGLLYSLMAAGCHSVIGSLWRVDDASTAELMSKFYRELSNSHDQNLADALRQAQIQLIRGSGTSSPYHWAPFIVQGAWSSLTFGSPQATADLSPQIVVRPERRCTVHVDQGDALLARAMLERERQPFSLLADSERQGLEDAIQAFTQAQTIDERCEAALVGRGIAFYRLMRRNEATSDLSNAVGIAPLDARANAYLGIIFAEDKERRRDAIGFLERAFVSNERLELPYQRLNTYKLRRLLSTLRAEQSVDDVSARLNVESPDADLLLQRGLAFQEISYAKDSETNRGKALDDYAAALALDPVNALAEVRLAWLRSGANELRIDEFKSIVSRHPDCAEARLRLAQAYEGGHEPAAAVPEYLEALRLDPQINHAASGLGKSLLEEGDLKGAIEAFELEVRNHPDLHTPYLYLKEAYAALGRYEESKQAYAEALRTTEHSLYEGRLGVDLVDKVTDWIRILASRSMPHAKSHSRSELQGLFSQANQLANKNDNPGAIDLYTRIIVLDPQNALARAYRAACRDLIGEHEEALEDCKAAVNLDPKCAVAWFNLGVLYQRRWDIESSKACFDRAATLDPSLTAKSGNAQKKDQSETFSEGIEQSLARAYRGSALSCAVCGKNLRRPTGGLLIVHGGGFDKIMEGTPYYCAACKTTACFDCSAKVIRGQSLCPHCGGQVQAWGHSSGGN